MEAFNDRVSRAFGALGGRVNVSLHQTTISSHKRESDSTNAQPVEVSTAENGASLQPVSDWVSSSSRGFGLVSKRRAETEEPFRKEKEAGASLWSVAQTVERKKRLWEEVESSDDEEFEKKPKRAGFGGNSSRILEGAEKDDDAEGEMLSYVSLTEEPENADEEGDWVRQMVGMDEMLDNEEEEDGYDRMAAPTGTDPLGRMHTSSIGDAAEPFAKPVTFSRARRDSRANREAASARLREDDEELDRGGAKTQGENGGKLEPRGKQLAVGNGEGLERGKMGDEHAKAVQSEEDVQPIGQGKIEGVLMGQPTAMEEDVVPASVFEVVGGEVGLAGGIQSLEKSWGERLQEFTEPVFESGNMSLQSPSEVDATEMQSGERRAAERSDWMQDDTTASGSGSIPDEQPLNFPNYHSGFMSRSSQVIPASGALKRASEPAADETRVKKRVRFTEEVTDRDELKTREQEAAEAAGPTSGVQGGGAEEGSLEGFKGRATRRVGNGQQYLPPHRRAGHKRTADRVPDYVKHPEKYTMYTLDWSDEEDDMPNAGGGEERQNEGAFLDAVGRLKGELGNVRFEEPLEDVSGSASEIAAGRRSGDARDGSSARISGDTGEPSTSRAVGELPVKFVQRKKGTSGTEASKAVGSKGKVMEEESDKVVKPQVIVAASVEDLTELGTCEKEEGGGEGSAVLESAQQRLGFKRKGDGQRPNKRYRVRSGDGNG